MTKRLKVILSALVLFQCTALSMAWGEDDPAMEQQTIKLRDLKMPESKLKSIKELDETQAIVGGHGEMLIMDPCLSGLNTPECKARQAMHKRIAEYLKTSLHWTCGASNAQAPSAEEIARCGQAARGELKTAGCVLAKNNDTLDEDLKCKIGEGGHGVQCAAASLNCGQPTRERPKNPSGAKICSSDQKTLKGGETIGPLCVNAKFREEKVEYRNFVEGECSNPPIYDVEKCYESFVKKLNDQGCVFKTTASRQDCAIGDVDTSTYVGGRRRSTWNCKSETLNCRTSYSGACPKNFEAKGAEVTGRLFSPKAICVLNPQAPLETQTGNPTGTRK